MSFRSSVVCRSRSPSGSASNSTRLQQPDVRAGTGPSACWTSSNRKSPSTKMNNVRLTEILSVASDAVASFLETILREASAVRIDAGRIYEAEGAADVPPHPLTLALKAGGQVVAGVSIGEEWLETLSQAMLGLPLKMGEEGRSEERRV